MRSKRSEIWVGIFVLIGIILLVLMTMKIEKFQIGEKAGYLLNVYFDSVPGLDRNSPVRVVGVHVGDVEKLHWNRGKRRSLFVSREISTFIRMQKPISNRKGFWERNMLKSLLGRQGIQN